MILTGNLKDFGLTELLQMMGNGHKSGLLEIFTEEGECRIYFIAGHLVHAEKGELSGEEAFYEVFRTAGGRFAFSSEPRPFSRTIFSDLTGLLIEAARLMDESKRNGDEPGGVEWEIHEEGGSAPEPDYTEIAAAGVRVLESWELADPEGVEEPSQVESSMEAAEEAQASVSYHPHLVASARILAERIASSHLAADYVVFSRDGLLAGGRGDEPGLFAQLRLDGLSESAPLDGTRSAAAVASLLDGADEIGRALKAGAVNYVTIHTTLGERAVVFNLGGLNAAAGLVPGARPAAFHSELMGLAALGGAFCESTTTTG